MDSVKSSIQTDASIHYLYSISLVTHNGKIHFVLF